MAEHSGRSDNDTTTAATAPVRKAGAERGLPRLDDDESVDDDRTVQREVDPLIVDALPNFAAPLPRPGTPRRPTMVGIAPPPPRLASKSPTAAPPRSTPVRSVSVRSEALIDLSGGPESDETELRTVVAELNPHADLTAPATPRTGPPPEEAEDVPTTKSPQSLAHEAMQLNARLRAPIPAAGRPAVPYGDDESVTTRGSPVAVEGEDESVTETSPNHPPQPSKLSQLVNGPRRMPTPGPAALSLPPLIEDRERQAAQKPFTRPKTVRSSAPPPMMNPGLDDESESITRDAPEAIRRLARDEVALADDAAETAALGAPPVRPPPQRSGPPLTAPPMLGPPPSFPPSMSPAQPFGPPISSAQPMHPPMAPGPPLGPPPRAPEPPLVPSLVGPPTPAGPMFPAAVMPRAHEVQPNPFAKTEHAAAHSSRSLQMQSPLVAPLVAPLTPHAPPLVPSSPPPVAAPQRPGDPPRHRRKKVSTLSKRPRYGFVLGFVAVLCLALPLSLYVVLQPPSDRVVRYPLEVVPDPVGRVDVARGKAVSSASAAHSATKPPKRR